MRFAAQYRSCESWSEVHMSHAIVRKLLPPIRVVRAAERHKERSDAERRNEGFPSW